MRSARIPTPTEEPVREDGGRRSMARTMRRRGSGRLAAAQLELGSTEKVTSKRRPNPTAVKCLPGQRQSTFLAALSLLEMELDELPSHSLREKAVHPREKDQQKPGPLAPA